MDDVLVAGEALIDLVPASPGPLESVESFARRAGGAPANVAAGLARLGVPPLLWTRIGDDPFGDYLAAELAAAGVRDRFVERDPDAPTALAFVAHDGGGDPSFAFYRSGTADTRMERGSVPDETIRDVGWLYLGGVALADGPSRTALLDLLSRATAAGDSSGPTVVFDPNHRPEVWDPGAFASTARRVIERADVVAATPAELRAAGFEGSPGDLPAAVSARGPHTVLLTLGSDGARVRSTDAAPWGADAAEHPGYDVEVVDATGAGDAFVAGAIAALSAGEPLPEVLSFATAVAALSTTAEGAMAALPDEEAVRAFRDAR